MRRLLSALIVLALSACADGAQTFGDGPPPAADPTSTTGESTTTITLAPPAPATTTPAPTTASPPATSAPTTASPPATSTSTTVPDMEPSGPGPSGVEIHLPDDPSDAPIAVLVHGGGWVAGTPVSMEPLADALADRGMVVFNASYRTGSDGGGYPSSFDDVACAVRFARHRGEDIGAADEVTLVGHSAGAHLSAVVALSEDEFGPECAWDESSTPDRLVGLAGIYQPDAVAPLMELFLGGTRATAAEAWTAADPFVHLPAAEEFPTVLVHGLDDRIVSAEASEVFAEALDGVGAEVLVELVEGGHIDVISGDASAGIIAEGS